MGRTELQKYSTPVKPEVVTAGSNTCKNSNCSQLCLGDDKCGCYGGFQLRRDGVSCEDVDECRTGNVCGVHGCVNLLGSYRCECKAGFNFNSITKLCEDINECLTNSHNCISGQACINTEGSFRCQRATSCGTGYELTANNICRDIDECALGTHNCGPDFICTNTEGSFRCRPKDKCGDGYIQDAIGSCIDINECVVHHNLCPHRQTCINTVGSYTCRSDTVTCGQGYHLTEDSSRCEDVDECRTGNVCGVHGCVNLLGSYRCECKAGYNFNSITKLCEDINECLHYPGRLCAHKCENTEGSYKCSCTSGFKLSYNGKSCEDINECLTNSHNCISGQVCFNTEGSFRCRPKDKCEDGYIQDAIGSCIDINECVVHHNLCPHGQTCINTVGSYTCRSDTVTCGQGYHLTEDGSRCEDVDECRTGNVCGVHGCVNLLGSYRCECKAGYNFNSITKLCEDINECLHYPGRLCAHKCENTEGSYKCSCTSGFKLSYDGKSCEDVNECEAKPCSQECVNFYGSYQCYCRRGYQLSDIDGKTCEDIDECATGGHSCSYHCFNTPGSFNCTCPPSGYTLANDWRTCQDIDECAAGTHTCSVSQSCFNVLGGYRCLAFQCPPNFRQAASGSRADASATVRCIKSCQPHDINCAHQFVSLITHSAISLPTLKGSTEPQEIILLRTTVPAAPLPNATDVSFVILGAENRVFFDVVQRSDNGVILGVVRQVKPIFGPSDLVLEVSMNYVNSEGIPQSSVIIIHVFISEFSF
ncbi:fibulin-1-like isoform X2 [Acanthochromis polyacanthus]|uniref:fibulin-1-like isoform X2 n=1 Tax=Acanthochromis polyacanthus TaxID=80966 RepID=UPI0022343526|nr:fibulin-1-like isoform X2 [Acanthochromis polyacanthus]